MPMRCARALLRRDRLRPAFPHQRTKRGRDDLRRSHTVWIRALRQVRWSGLATRWWWVLFLLLVDVAANLIDLAIGVPIFSTIVGLGLLLPNLSVSIRRLHDTNRTGWWILIGLIPLIGWIVLLVFYLQQGDAGENRFGPPPVTVTAPATTG